MIEVIWLAVVTAAVIVLAIAVIRVSAVPPCQWDGDPSTDELKRRINFLEEYVASIAEETAAQRKKKLSPMGLHEASEETKAAMFPWR